MIDNSTISIKECWTRFEKWLRDNAPHLAEVLNNGASSAQIDKLEQIINHKLPEDFKEFYQIHDGQNTEDEGLIVNEQFLSIDKVIDQWTIWDDLLEQFQDDPVNSEPDEGIKNDWWNPLWVPFTHDGSGNHICIDLDPAPTGHSGQVIRMWHDMYQRALYGASFLEWFNNYVNGLENGKYIYAKGWGLVDRDSPFPRH